MKTKLALVFLMLIGASTALADMCTVTIKDRYNYEYDRYTRHSYSVDAACSEATYDCSRALSEYQSRGHQYGSRCEITHISDSNTPPSYPPPIPPSSPYPSYPPSYPNYPSYPSYPDRPREPRYPNNPKPPRPPRWPR